MPSLALDRATHTYTLGEKVIPSVTQVLKDQGILVINDFSTGPELGREVHEATEALDLGFYDASAYSPEVKLYIEAYGAFKEATKFEPRGVELMVYNKQYDYAGMLDRLGLLNGRGALVDFKTGVPHVATVIQIAGYWGALEQPVKDKIACYSLHLKADGKYKLDKIKPANLFAAWKIFLSALAVYQFRQDNNLF